jgi:hypothetical protein
MNLQATFLFIIVRDILYIMSELLCRDVAQLGSALRSGRRGRWFESSHPDFVVHSQIKGRNSQISVVIRTLRSLWWF